MRLIQLQFSGEIKIQEHLDLSADIDGDGQEMCLTRITTIGFGGATP